MLQPGENLFAVIADDLAQPNVAIDRDEQSAFVQAGRLRVSDNVWVKEIVPDLYNLSLTPPAIHAQVGQHTRHDGARRLGSQGSCLLEGHQIDASPLSHDALARAHFAGAARRVIARERRQHGLRGEWQKLHRYLGYMVT
jgi:hypothetical protein